MLELDNAPTSQKETTRPDKYEPIKNALLALASDFEPSGNDNKPTIYLMGSLGRHISLSGAKSWNEYLEAIFLNPKLKPRRDFRGLWEIDIAVPTGSIAWNSLAEVAKGVSLTNSLIEIDPHYININQKIGRITRNAQFSNTGTNFNTEQFSFQVDSDTPSRVTILNRWSQLFLYLSDKNLRKKDASEIMLIFRYLVKSGDLSNIVKKNEAISLIKSNKTLFSTRNAVLLPYRLLTPPKLREKLYRIKKEGIGTKNVDRQQVELRARHYESAEPLYF